MIAHVLRDMIAAVDIGKPRAAVRIALEFADERLRAGDDSALALLLEGAPIDRLGTTAALGILAATHPAKAPERERFIARLRAFLERTDPRGVDALMRGVA